MYWNSLCSQSTSTGQWGEDRRCPWSKATMNNKWETLPQRRLKEKMDTQACPLTSTWAMAHAYPHSCMPMHTESYMHPKIIKWKRSEKTSQGSMCVCYANKTVLLREKWTIMDTKLRVARTQLCMFFFSTNSVIQRRSSGMTSWMPAALLAQLHGNIFFSLQDKPDATAIWCIQNTKLR